MAPKVALFLALGLLLAAAAHGCEPYCSSPVVPTPPPPSHSQAGRCDTLKLSVCANVLDLIKVGLPPHPRCCPLLEGLVDLDAALCLCTAIKANVLNIVNLSVPVSLELILNNYGKTCPKDFTCP